MSPTQTMLNATILNQAIQAVCKQNLVNNHSELCTYEQVAMYLNNGYNDYEMYLNNGCNCHEIIEQLKELQSHVSDWWRVVGKDGLLETEPANLRLEQYRELEKHGFLFAGPNVIL